LPAITTALLIDQLAAADAVHVAVPIGLVVFAVLVEADHRLVIAHVEERSSEGGAASDSYTSGKTAR